MSVASGFEGFPTTPPPTHNTTLWHTYEATHLLHVGRGDGQPRFCTKQDRPQGGKDEAEVASTYPSLTLQTQTKERTRRPIEHMRRPPPFVFMCLIFQYSPSYGIYFLQQVYDSSQRANCLQDHSSHISHIYPSGACYVIFVNNASKISTKPFRGGTSENNGVQKGSGEFGLGATPIESQDANLWSKYDHVFLIVLYFSLVRIHTD